MTGPGSSSVITNERAFKWWDYPAFIFLSLLSLWAIFSFLFHWFSYEDWLVYPVSFLLMTVLLVVILANNQGRWFLLPYMRKPRPVRTRAGWKVAAVTTFVPGGESLEMLEGTVNALVSLDYPHDTWVLDEGDDEKVSGALPEDLERAILAGKSFPSIKPRGYLSVGLKARQL